MIRTLAYAGCITLMVLTSALARPVEITILHTTDLHGHIWPTSDYDGQTDLGGFLRIASRIEALRSGATNTLLIDVGDTFQGSPESYLTRGRLMVDGLNYLSYDAWVLGNHEIDWGPSTLRGLHDMVEVPFLAGNLYFPPDEVNWLPKIQPFIIREIDGIRIAIIGLTTPGIPRWSRPHLLDGAMFKGSVSALEEILPAVHKAGADVIIVAAHQGFISRGDTFANEISAIARTFPEIDILLGGHTHKPVDDMRFQNVLYSQAGYYGIWLGEIKLTYDTVEKRVVEKRGRLERMDARVPYHAGLLERWQHQLDEAKAQLDRVIAYLPEELDPSPDEIGRSSMQDLIARSIADGADVGFVVHGSLSDKPVGPGPFTYRMVWEIVPYENSIGIVSLTPQEMREVLNENHLRALSSQSLGPFGFSYQLESTGTDARQVGVLRDRAGDALHSRGRHDIAFNSYSLASGGNRYMRLRELADAPESRLRMLPVDTRSLVVRYLEKNYPRRENAVVPAE